MDVAELAVAPVAPVAARSLDDSPELVLASLCCCSRWSRISFRTSHHARDPLGERLQLVLEATLADGPERMTSPFCTFTSTSLASRSG